ncbi:oxalate:formate antiporter-like [Plakobranchus ocellatus]|uniref:Oxalate:formate antiporter-like n=1 Tax=Plakobranchus ocellatus TaxID=259542 RepID=A0AAV3Z5V9_9GAST|nr:oxalate:formate antiporter-like [Plakobranchus ocellatus]
MRSEKCAKYLTLVGAHFVNAPLSFVWLYGNLSAYMESYFMCYCYPACVDGDSQWILTLFVASGCPGLFFASPVIKRLGIKWAGILATIVCAIGFFVTAWTIRVSVIATAVFMGLITGMGAGTTVCAGFVFVNAYAGKHIGVLLATTTSAPTILAIVQNQIITAYVNPNNLKADTQKGPKVYFSQPEILERVPEVILIIGAMSLGLQIIGYFLVSSPPPPSPETQDKPYSITENDPQEFISQDSDNQNRGQAHCDGNNIRSASENVLNNRSGLLINSNETQNYKANVCCQEELAQTLSMQSQDKNSKADAIKPSSDASTKHVTKINASHRNGTRSLKAAETLRTHSFKVFWLYGVAMVYGLILKNNYYKQFGLIYINNDRYLTLVGSLIPVVASSARVIFGSLTDKGILSIKDCMCLSLSVNSVLCAFWFFIPQISTIGYMFLVLGLASIHSLVYTIAAAGTLQMFGEEHFSSNFTMMYSSSTAAAILSALIVSELLKNVGWFWLFATCSIVSLCILGLTVFTDFPTTKTARH